MSELKHAGSPPAHVFYGIGLVWWEMVTDHRPLCSRFHQRGADHERS